MEHLNSKAETGPAIERATVCKSGGNSVVEFQLPKLTTRVRFPSPAPYKR